MLRGFEHSSFEFVSDFDIRISRLRLIETDKLSLNTALKRESRSGQLSRETF